MMETEENKPSKINSILRNAAENYIWFAKAVTIRYSKCKNLEKNDVQLVKMYNDSQTNCINVMTKTPDDMYFDFLFDLNVDHICMKQIKTIQSTDVTEYINMDPYDIMDKPLKVFISQPMRYKTSEEIEEKRKSLIEYAHSVTGKKIEPLDTYFKENIAKTPMDNIGHSIQLMGDADIVVFAKEWEEYRGCRIEYQCAKEYEKKILIEE